MVLENLLYSLFYVAGHLLADSQPNALTTTDTLQVKSPTTAQVEWHLAQLETEQAEQLFEQGVALHRDRRFEEAIQAYQEAIRIDPMYDSAYINMGLALIQLGQLNSAVPIFQQVLTLPDREEEPASNHTLAHYNLAIIFNRQGRTQEALSEVQQALDITPDFEQAQQLLEQIQ